MKARITAALALVTLALSVGASTASADVQGFCNSGIAANSRCIWGVRKWLYGVGVYNSGFSANDQYVCVGAKTNSDGSGGNALPFRCEHMTHDQTMWTPGGNSNWGWATIINDDPRIFIGGGTVNFQP